MKSFKISVVLIAIGFFFNLIETAYFGWNIKPQSPEEMICDYIAIGLMGAGKIGVAYSIMVLGEALYRITVSTGIAFVNFRDAITSRESADNGR